MNARRADAGFTFVELLVGLSLLALVLLVLLSAGSVGMSKVREARNETDGIVWVQAAMESAMAVGLDGLPNTGRYDVFRVLRVEALPDAFASGQLHVQVVSLQPLLKEVTVAIYRRQAPSQPAFSLTTIVGSVRAR